MPSESSSLLSFSDEIAAIVERSARFVAAVNGGPRLASSGVIWREGILVTAAHTIRRDDELDVVLPDGRTSPGKLAGRDAGTDLAVIRVDTGGHAAAAFGDAASLKVGNMVVAVGRRGENGPCAGIGILSALGGPWRTWRNGQIARFVRADVSLYPGSSGSALVDMQGRVLGVNTAGLTRNWSVTIPNETVESVITALLAHGHVARGFLGVGLQPVRLSDGRAGVIVLSVEAGGPAATAGLLIGDVILKLAGQPVSDTDDVQIHLGPEQVGKPLAAEVYRAGSLQTLSITVGARARAA